MDTDATRVAVEAILAEAAQTSDLASALRARLDPAVRFHLPNGDEGGLALFEAFLRETFGSFPDVVVTLDAFAVEGARAFVQFTLEGSHTGAFRGFSATGRRFALPTAWVLQFDRGCIVEMWYYASIYDALEPAPPAGPVSP